VRYYRSLQCCERLLRQAEKTAGAKPAFINQMKPAARVIERAQIRVVVSIEEQNEHGIRSVRLSDL
jgi:hypothetical protein